MKAVWSVEIKYLYMYTLSVHVHIICTCTHYLYMIEGNLERNHSWESDGRDSN